MGQDASKLTMNHNSGVSDTNKSSSSAVSVSDDLTSSQENFLVIDREDKAHRIGTILNRSRQGNSIFSAKEMLVECFFLSIENQIEIKK